MNIRLRLSLLFSIATSFIVGILLFTVYSTVVAGRQRAYFAQMETRALAVADVFFLQNSFDVQKFEDARQQFKSSFAASVAAVIDSRNQMIDAMRNDSAYRLHHTATSLIVTPFVPDTNALFTARSEGKSRRITRQGEMTFYDVYLLRPDKQNDYVIVVRGIDKQGAELLESLRLILFIGGCIFPLVAFGTGWVFTGVALNPMQRITAVAKQISASNLSRRLPEADGNDEIAVLAQTFNSVFGQLESAFDAQKRFIAHASHELRTPLTILEGEVSVTLQRARTEEEYRQTLETMQRTILRLHRLTTNLLTLSHLESGLADLPMREEFLDEMLHHSLADVRTRFPQREFQVHDEILQNREVILRCNRELVETAFTNILENAVKYSNRDTLVQISVSIPGEHCVLKVRDEGLGISKEELQHIFTPFYRAERTRSLKGSGIGLALVKAILHLHHGTIYIESFPHEGTTIVINLPLFLP